MSAFGFPPPNDPGLQPPVAVVQAASGNYPQDAFGNWAIGSPMSAIQPGATQPGQAGHNFGIGPNSDQGTVLGKLTTGYYNTAVGWGAGANITTGQSNSILGEGAGFHLTTGFNNTAIGTNALEFATGVQSCVVVGTGAAQNNTADYTTAVGCFALQNNTSGSQNTAVGEQALLTNTTGLNNTAVGVNAAKLNSVGEELTAIGNGALSNATGSYSTAVGYNALSGLVGGSQCVAVGYQAGSALTTGTSNTAIGINAGNTDGTTATNQFCNNITLLGERAQSQVNDVIVLGKAVATRPNLCFGAVPSGAGFFGNGVGVFFLANAVTDPTANPTGGGLFYISGGALKYRGPTGTITTIAPA